MNDLRFPGFARLALVLMLVFASASAIAQAESWRPLLVAADVRAAEEPNYGAWEKFVAAFSQRAGKRHRIAFTAIEQHGLEFLRRYAGYLLAQPIEDLDSRQQLVWWLNLHNALVLFTLSEEGPEDLAVQRGMPGAPGPLWSRKLVEVRDIPLSLADIEALVVAGWGADPRVIYGLYQGVRSGPELPPKAFTTAELDAQLQTSAEQFVRDKRLVRVRRNTASLSPWVLWHREALFADDAALLRHLGEHARGRLSRNLHAASTLEARTFDWTADVYIAPRNQLDFDSAANQGFGS